jgi:unsaturated rhamnogalacturonyl hydrolase
MPAQKNSTSLMRRIVSKSLRVLGRYRETKMTTLKPGMEWFHLINSVNRGVLNNRLDKELHNLRAGHKGGTASIPDYAWKIALSALGAECAHRAYGSSLDLDALRSFYRRNIDQQGNWVTRIDRVEHAMKGYTLLYLAQLTGETQYRQAADQLVDSLVSKHPRAQDGSLTYDTNTESILVDTLGMVCPFLARYNSVYGNTDALDLSVNQLKQFILNNVDQDTKLPYHGYYAFGSKRLGMHAWGRGTGWYMMGLIDTLVEMPAGHPYYAVLVSSFVAAATSLRQFQREDGHWNWAILNKMDSPDSSTTSMIGYSILRAVRCDLLDASFQNVVDKAIAALLSVTHSDGVLDGSLAECRGLGKYPQVYQPTLWLQGSATAFGALYFCENRK